MIRPAARHTIAAAGLALALLSPVALRANDSSAELKSGGLVLTRDPAVEMRSEDLFISAKAVRVRYRFANTSPRPVTILVAFPMPDITIEGEDDNISVPTQDPVNFLDFHTTVDGRAVAAQVEQKVFARGVDRTAYLRALGVPLAPHLQATNTVLDALPKAKRDEIIRLGLGQIMEYDAGKGWERHLYATWTLKTTYFWRQTFPAGREIVVEHRYRPSVGETAGTSWGADYFRKDPQYVRLRAHYCVDDGFLKAIAATPHRADVEFAPYTEQRIEYILSTGANWKAPIGDFHMVIDKGDADSLVSFCGQGVRKIGPTQFEVRYRDFTPRQEVSVLILKRMNGATP
ncbi:DUF4424 domain-containing protein [Caulobacter sp. KR2-114]|uniref:DUF4424 domain-containing protein n=1 Tax=Caulobacter sp. KR2-114 TaxID=3400912 RepID=UPI003C0F789F